MRRERLIEIMLFFALVEEGPGMYGDLMWTPMRLANWFYDPKSLKVSIFEMVCVVLLLTAKKRAGLAHKNPMRWAISVSLMTIIGAAAFGLMRGGLIKPIYAQAHSWLTGLLFTATVLSNLSTLESYTRLVRTVVYAAVFRSLVLLIFYFSIARYLVPLPPTMTTHDDTVVFVFALIALITFALESRSKTAIRQLAFLSPVILAAIHFNNRRLAWASLVLGLIIVYVLLPKQSKALKRLNRVLIFLVPMMATYVTVGWGRSERIFKPIASFASMGVGEKDASTIAREIENRGLMIMARERPLLGTGFGHEWLEIDNRYTVPVSVYPNYHYTPHNTIQAVVAFTGGAGYAGIFMVYAVGAFLAARAYRFSKDPAGRAISATSLATFLVVGNQNFGDMGFISTVPLLIGGLALASAGGLAVLTGAWTVDRRSLKTTTQAPRANAAQA